MSMEITIIYKNQKLLKTFSASDTFQKIYSECKNTFGIHEDHTKFFFYTNKQEDITNHPIGNNRTISEDYKLMYLISKNDMQAIAQFLQNQYPSIRYESLSIYSPMMNILTRLHSLHEAICSIDEQNCALLSSLLPHDELSGKDEIQSVKFLANWFSEGFFKLLNDPICHLCQSPTTFVGYQPPLQSEVDSGYNVAEKFQCNSCQAITRLLRTKNIEFLIFETRRKSG